MISRLHTISVFMLLVIAMPMLAQQQLQWQPINTAWSLRDPYNITTRVTAPINRMYVSNTNGNQTLWVAGKSGLYRTANNGFAWDSVGKSGTEYLAVTQRGNSYFAIMKIGESTYVIRSTDNGVTWEMNPNAQISEAVTNIVSNGRVVMACGVNNGLYKSTDDGNTWRFVDVARYCTALEAIGTSFYAGTNDGFVFRSTDDGATWTNVGCSCNAVTCIAVKDNVVMAGSPGGVCATTDNGATWKSYNNGLDAQYITSIIVVGNNVYASSAGRGVYRSGILGNSILATWVPNNIGLGNLMVSDMVLMNNRLYAGTQNQVYAANPEGTFVSVEDGAEVALALTPNPATFQANVSFTGTASTNATVSVVDVLGRIVATNSVVTTDGVNNVAVPVAQIGNGTYTMLISMNGVTYSRQFVIAR